jgi:hypothetical protein
MTIKINLKHSFVYDGIKLNVYHANKGEGLPKHEHIYSHATICHSGSCKVSLEGRNYIIDKNHKPLNLLAGEMIKTIQDELVGSEFKPRHTIEIYCPNCGYDVSEAELAAKMCSDCGHSLEEPEQHVAIVVANMSFGGSTL